ncbi:MAG: dienelactone hydrolase family protein [Pseudomonadota bacterium]|nr:dienelactone hydrolase family protein [Pseudomonadota bacterium]
MGRRVKIAATDGSGAFGAYVSPLPALQGPGIVMLHEILGITPWIEEVADQFAARGYCVIAPDMFWRLEPDFVADYRIPKQREKGLRFRGKIDHDKAVDDIAAVIDNLKSLPECNGKIAVVGYCMGGTLTYLASARLNPDAAIVYYGTEVQKFLDEGPNIFCPTIFHAGDRDHHVPLELLNEIRDTLEDLPDVTFHVYDADHAFANTHRPELFSAGPTEQAHARSFELLDTLR